MSTLSTNFNAALEVISKCQSDARFMGAFQAFQSLLIETVTQEKNVFTCGNGGSHCDAMHFAEELTGRFKKDRRPIGGLVLGEAAHTTCVGNDYGFEFVFSRQVEGLGRSGDLLIAISTSGNSENVIAAVKAARAKGMKTVGLLGKDGGALATLVDVPVIVPTDSTERIQEIHIKVIHSVIEGMERQLFPENYA